MNRYDIKNKQSELITHTYKAQTPLEHHVEWGEVGSYDVIVTDITTQEELNHCLETRRQEYPPMADYLDGIVKGDQVQIQKYINDCLAVKTKYPKPV